MQVNDWQELFTKVDKKLSDLNVDNELRTNLASICIALPGIVESAQASDYKDIKGNGFRTFLTFSYKFGQLLEQSIDHLDSCYDDLLCVSRVVLKMSQVLNEISSKDKPDNGTVLTKNIHPFAFSQSLFMFLKDNKSDLATMLAKYPGFWLPDSSRSVWTNFFRMYALLSNPFSIFMSKARQGNNAMDTLLYGTMEYPANLLRPAMKYLMPLAGLFKLGSGVVCKDFDIVPTSPYIIDQKSHEILKSDQRRPTHKVRIITLKNLQNLHSDQSVIFHIHGGGFIAGSPYADKTVYLEDQCKKLDGTVIVAVEYSVTRPFPAGLQDVLDAYLWLTTDPNAEQRLEFKANQKIIVMGESAGANLAVALVTLLNEIKNIYGLSDKVLPKQILSVYGIFLITPSLSPSRVFSFIDTIIPVSMYLIMVQQYGGVNCKSDQVSNEYKILRHFKSAFSLLRNAFRLLSSNYNLPWYMESDENAEYFSKLAAKTLNCPHASPLLYEKFNEINIPLTIVAAEYCSLLDDSIALAKHWTGPVSFHLFEEATHGFLHFGASSKQKDRFVDIIKDLLKFDNFENTK